MVIVTDLKIVGSKRFAFLMSDRNDIQELKEFCAVNGIKGLIPAFWDETIPCLGIGEEERSIATSKGAQCVDDVTAQRIAKDFPKP